MEGRERGGLSDLAGVTDQMAKQYETQANQVVSEWLAGEESKIQGLLDSGQISQEGALARRQENQAQAAEYTKLLIEAAKSANTGGSKPVGTPTAPPTNYGDGTMSPTMI
jgi:hypothetical protein